jgi:Ca2+-dependent lipid-binding protein
MKTSIKIKIFECRDLPAVDRNGLSDPYVCLKTNELLLQTKVIPKTLNPVYNQGFIVSISPATLRGCFY